MLNLILTLLLQTTFLRNQNKNHFKYKQKSRNGTVDFAQPVGGLQDRGDGSDDVRHGTVTAARSAVVEMLTDVRSTAA